MPEALLVAVAAVLVLAAAAGTVLVQVALRAAAFRRLSLRSRTMARLGGGTAGGRRRVRLPEPLPTVRPVAEGQEMRADGGRGPSRSHHSGNSTLSDRSPTSTEPSMRA